MKKKNGGQCGKCGLWLPCKKCVIETPLGDQAIKGWAAYWKNKKQKKEA